MDSPKIYHSRLKTSVTLILIIFLTLFASNLEGSQNLKKYHRSKGLINQKKSVLGSRPPRCVNKCLNCRPCMATLVISPHHKVGQIHKAKITAEKDEGYYLMSWKCKCGNKFFQP